MKKDKNKTFRREPICCSVLDGNGLVLRVLPNVRAADNWIRKHFPDSGASVTKRPYYSKFGVLKEFDQQMQLGLVETRTIYDMLFYGGVSTNWTPDKAKRVRRGTHN